VTYDWESGSDIKEELWNIFTYYCLCDDPSRIDTMTMRAFCKMFGDSQLLGLERREIGDEDCNVVYVRASGATSNRLMDYETFVNALTILAKKIFWDISRGDDAFREALIEYILPHAHRRRPQAVHRQMMQPDVVTVFKPVRTALVRIFEFYGTVLDEPKVKGDFGWERIGEREAKVWYTKTRKKVGPLARPRIKALVPNPVTSARRGPHNMAAAMFFDAWKRFAVDFGLDDILTQMDLAEVFLASSKQRKGRGFLKFNQFCEGLMRCALISSRSGASSSILLFAFSILLFTTVLFDVRSLAASRREHRRLRRARGADRTHPPFLPLPPSSLSLAPARALSPSYPPVDHPDITLECRLRALFLHMARYVTGSLRTKVDSKAKELRVSNSLGTLIQGSKTFQLVVTKQWFNDGQRDYLVPVAREARSGIQMLDDLVSARSARGGGSSSRGGGGRSGRR
jgi:hypothetical protein